MYMKKASDSCHQLVPIRLDAFTGEPPLALRQIGRQCRPDYFKGSTMDFFPGHSFLLVFDPPY